MAQKRSASVKSVAKPPLNKKEVKKKTVASKSSSPEMAKTGHTDTVASAGIETTSVPARTMKSAAAAKKTSTALSDAHSTAATAAKVTARATSSRRKIAPAKATQRASAAAAATGPGNTPLAKSAKSVKNVAAVAKPLVKQSKPVNGVDAVAKVPPKQSSGSAHSFEPKEYIVYPAHGVGQIVDVEEQEIAGLSLELFVITFEKDKMTLRVPTNKFESVGMRKLASPKIVEKAMTVLKGRARVKRTMWSRRAQEYEAKINSGDLISVAEVVRDLFRADNQPEQSYSERQLYEQALDRMSREIAVVEKLDDRGATQRITDVLSKSAKSRQAAEKSAEANDVGSDVEAA